jgi:thioredoxin-related protein
MRNLLIAALLGTFFSLPLRAQELIMFEEKGCIWCARWNEEVGQIYPLTPEAAAAPLRRVDVNKPLPEDIENISRIAYTPTFVLFDDGREVGRIEGYPGEAFFWGLLGKMLNDINERGSS